MNSKKIAANANVKVCANCGLIGAVLICARCKACNYCSKACQKQHWKSGHKEMCLTPEERRPQTTASRGADKPQNPFIVGKYEEVGTAECPICLDSLSGCAVCTLPCNHAFHQECVEQLRKHGVQQVCPLCRATLPVGPGKKFEDATRMFVAILRQVGGNDPVLWQSLTGSQQRKLVIVINMLTSAANQCCAGAQLNLGLIYHFGYGVTQDHNEAAQWYRKAAEQDNITAQFNLGTMYEDGKGVAQNHEEAAHWYFKAADRGHVNAQTNLGSMYDAGYGVVQDHNEAVKWFHKAAGRGLADAQFNLGTMYHHRKGIYQDYKEAVRWYRKAADQRHAHAQFNLGTMYHHGTGVDQDYKEAAQWYRKAAEQGLADPQFNLGTMYYNGQGVAQDHNETIQWFHKAAEQDHVTAQFCLGTMYHNGQGVVQDHNEAVQWFHKAAEQDHVRAQFCLGTMYHNGQGVVQDHNEAVQWFHKAADQGYADAQYMLGLSFYLGKGDVPRDLHKAAFFLSIAKAQGHVKAQSLLEEFPSQCACCRRVSSDDLALKPCPGCNAFVYCGKECQRKHWIAEHKVRCERKNNM